MKRRDKIRELQAQKEAMNRALSELEMGYHSGMLNKHQYLEQKQEIMDWKIEDVKSEMDNQMNSFQSKNVILPAAAIAIFAVILAFSFMDGGITSLVIFDNAGVSTYDLGQRFIDNGTINATNITATTLRVDGEVFGYGEAWIYLVDGENRRLVYYTDTSQAGLTGFVVAGTEVETIPEPNATNVTEIPEPVVEVPVESNETNETINDTLTPLESGNETTNETTTPIEVNDTETNETINETVEPDTNVSLNETPVNVTDPVDTPVNDTEPVNTTEPVAPEILLSGDTFSMGDYININIVPADAVFTLYIHTPTETYLLNDDYWVASEVGEHELVALVSTLETSERITATFTVESASETATETFTQACVDTCEIGDTPVYLEIVIDGVEVQLDSFTYDGELVIINETNETGKETGKPVKPPKEDNQPAKVTKRNCLAKNPNHRPKECFTAENRAEFFIQKDFTLINEQGMVMATIDGDGNMKIKGTLIEYSTGTPQDYDLVIRGSVGSAAWFDALTGDLNLRGAVFDNQETLDWISRQDYVVSNDNGIYLAIFDAQGHLYIRGIIIEE